MSFLSFFGIGNEVTIDKSKIMKEGYLSKESQIIKTWRQRWTVLDNNVLATFEKEGKYTNATEVLNVKDIKSVKSDEPETCLRFVMQYIYNILFRKL